MTTHALQVRGLRKSYDALEVDAGECFELLAPSGAGKTMTLRFCLGRLAMIVAYAMVGYTVAVVLTRRRILR